MHYFDSTKQFAVFLLRKNICFIFREKYLDVSYDDSTRLVTFVPNEEVHWYSDPSYCLPAFLELWTKKADSDNEEDKALAREYVQRLWDVQPPTGKWRYYIGMVYFLSMLHVAGQFSI